MSSADPARDELDAAVIAWTREQPWSRGDARFDRLALALFAFQFERCAPYRRFCEARGWTPANVRRVPQFFARNSIEPRLLSYHRMNAPRWPPIHRHLFTA